MGRMANPGAFENWQLKLTYSLVSSTLCYWYTDTGQQQGKQPVKSNSTLQHSKAKLKYSKNLITRMSVNLNRMITCGSGSGSTSRRSHLMVIGSPTDGSLPMTRYGGWDGLEQAASTRSLRMSSKFHAPTDRSLVRRVTSPVST